MKEADLTRKILALLKETRGCKAVKFHGSEYSETGTPDIVACYLGRALLIEVKVGRNPATKIQIHRHREWRQAGAKVALVRSLDEVRAVLQEIRDQKGIETCGQIESLKARLQSHPREDERGRDALR